MATASFAYCVGRDQVSRQKLADLFARTGLCISRQAAKQQRETSSKVIIWV